MKGSRVFRGMAVLTLAVFVAPQVSFAVQVPAGTQVPVQLVSSVTSDTVTLGGTVAVAAASDVIVGGRVVVKKGAPGTAEVTSVDKRGALGKPGEVLLEVKRIQAANNQDIFVSGSKRVEGKNKQTTTIILGIVICLPLLLLKGGDAVIPAGTVINATVTAPAEVN